MLIYFILVFGIYFILVGGLIIWLMKKSGAGDNTDTKSRSVSIIIPVRNEKENLPLLFRSLEGLDTRGLEVEFIFVDDHSDDNSSLLIQKWLNNKTGEKVQYLLSSGSGKKAALTTAIGCAKGEIILTTDADCELPSHWIHEMVFSFTPGTHMVVGKVKLLSDHSFFGELQAMEFASVMGTGIAFLSAGHPIMCNGASLAYTREAFQTVNGYEGNLDVPSGDDEFLMRKIQTRFPGSIRLVNGNHSVVSTHPQSTVNRFIHQRLRWAGKWNRNDSFLAKVLALFILSVQLSTILLFAFLLAGRFGQELLVVLSSKMLLEGLFLFVANRKLGQNFSIRAFISLQVIYPFYIGIIGILSQVAGYEWKGRSGG